MSAVWGRHGTGAAFRARTLHLTLMGLGWSVRLNPVLVAQARQVGGALANPSLALRFDRLMALGGGERSALAIIADDHIEDVAALAEDLHDGMRAAGLGLAPPRLRLPHVTLAYGRGLEVPRRLPAPLWWHIQEVLLIDSLHGDTTHVCLGRWILPDRPRTGC